MAIADRLESNQKESFERIAGLQKDLRNGFDSIETPDTSKIETQLFFLTVVFCVVVAFSLIAKGFAAIFSGGRAIWSYYQSKG